MKLKKRKKSSRIRGTRLCGYAAKKHKGKGSSGGKGMSGSGKRADQKKIMVIKKYGIDYMGGESLKKKKNKSKGLNIRDIGKKLEEWIILGKAKESKEGVELNLEGYKILSEGELKLKLIIKADSFSKKAKEKIEKVGGKAIELKEKRKKNFKIKEDNNQKKEKE